MYLQQTTIWLVPFLCACLAAEPPPGPAEPPTLLEISMTDSLGNRAQPGAAPRMPLWQLRFGHPMDLSDEPLMLLSGAVDEQLTEDLRRAPLLAKHAPRRVPLTVQERGSLVRLRPSTHLAPGERFSLVVAGWSRTSDGVDLSDNGQSFVQELRVSPEPAAGSAVLAHWPLDGAGDVTPALPQVLIALDGPAAAVSDGAWVQDPRGQAVSASLEFADCEGLPMVGHTCMVLSLGQALSPDTEYEVHVSAAVLDSSGAPIGPHVSRFRTGDGRAAPEVQWTLERCAPDELPLAQGCLLASDHDLTLRLGTTQPARIRLSTTEVQVVALSGAEAARLRISGLQPDQEHQLSLELVDTGGRRQSETLLVRTSEPLATLAIAEVRADPLGREPDQEYVELFNWGASPVELMGIGLVDDPFEEADGVAALVTVPAGGRALLVSDEFDPGAQEDVPTPPGTLLVRMGTSLARSGLANTGEHLVLRDGQGRRLSEAPASPAPEPGLCLVREARASGWQVTGSFFLDRVDGCTPGY